MIYGGANSLDNFLARSDGAVDWLRWNAGAAAIMKEMWQSIDTVIMGRKTFEAGKKMMGGGKAPRPSKKKKSTGGPPSVPTYVFSRTLPDEDGVSIVREDVVAFVRRLKDQPGQDILVMGGGELARALFEAGLIDRVGFNIHPVLLGTGVPAFHPMTRQIDLELVDSRPLGDGCVYVDYRVVRA
nr:dihydrofolate reductase family protein [uncultured bacterium]AGD93312.1 dihydrofolate reductase family protein [uncultured bacterium]